MIPLPPVVGGSLTAISWGSADFIARFSGRALGVLRALFWMITTSAVLITATAWITNQLPHAAVDALIAGEPAAFLLLLYGIGVTAATLLLYLALASGPVSVAAPIVGSYPALNLIIALALGTRPSHAQWLAMAAVMMGVAIVGRCAEQVEREQIGDSTHVRRTVLLSLAAAGTLGVALAAGQEASDRYGDLQTVCVGRWIGVVMCAAMLISRSEAVHIPLRWWPVVTVQGALDATAYVTVLLASAGAESPIAPVIGSTFFMVTVALAHVVLRERMSLGQWFGIVLVVIGVVSLSAY